MRACVRAYAVRTCAMRSCQGVPQALSGSGLASPPPVLLVPYHAPARALPRRAAHTRKHPPTAYGRYTLFEQFVARKAVPVFA